MALTARQQRFCEEYLVDLNGTQAAIRAGYTAHCANRTAVKLLSNTDIQATIQAGREAARRRTEVTVDYILRRLRENVERAMQCEQVLDSQGEPTGEYRYEGNVANKALELLGKHLGMFRDKVELTGDNAGPIQIRTIKVVQPTTASAPSDPSSGK